MKKKSKQEANARYKKKLSNIAMMEKSRDQLTKKELLLLVDENLQEARTHGVDIIVDYNIGADLYFVSVKDEEGRAICTLRRLPAMVNGLYLMGPKVRALFFEHRAKYQHKTKIQ